MLAYNMLSINVVGGMRREKVVVTVVVFGIVLVSGVVAPLSAFAGNDGYIVVDGNGKGDYSSIGDAINHAREGDTILVKPGEYREVLIINKMVTILGEDGNRTKINPTSIRNGFAIEVRASGAVLKNLNITNYGKGKYAQAVKIVSPDVKVIGCMIHDVPVGISIWSSNNTIKGCKFWNCKDEGVVLMGTRYTGCDGNSIVNCYFYNNGDGVELQHADGNVIMDCIMKSNLHSGVDILDFYSEDNIIVNCSITGNTYGVMYMSGSNVLVNCTVCDNADGNIVTNDVLGFSAKGGIKSIKGKFVKMLVEGILRRFGLRVVSGLLDAITRLPD